MSTATVDRPVTEESQDLVDIMAEARTLKPQQQEKLSLFIKGYVTAATLINERDKAAI